MPASTAEFSMQSALFSTMAALASTSSSRRRRRSSHLHFLHLTLVQVDFYLIFRDGRVAVGQDVPPQLSAFPPLYIIGGSSSATNYALLKFWAAQTGGEYLSVDKVCATFLRCVATDF